MGSVKCAKIEKSRESGRMALPPALNHNIFIEIMLAGKPNRDFYNFALIKLNTI
jgi:hypothetical protein